MVAQCIAAGRVFLKPFFTVHSVQRILPFDCGPRLGEMAAIYRAHYVIVKI